MSRLENTSACRLVACGTFILCALFYFCAHAANGSLLDGSSWIRGTSKNASRKAEQTSAHISLTVRQTDEGRGINLPTWCKTSRTHGAWHRLSDDEYKDESPYLRCAFPDGQLGRSSSLQTVHNPSGMTPVSAPYPSLVLTLALYCSVFPHGERQQPVCSLYQHQQAYLHLA